MRPHRFGTPVRMTTTVANSSSSGLPGLTRVEVVVVLSVVVLAVAIFVVILPSSLGPRELSPRTWCAANLSGIGKGLYTYANENNDFFPIATHAPATEMEKGRVTYAPGKTGFKRGNVFNQNAGETSETDTEMSNTRNLWTLVRLQASTPRLFLCPASNYTENTEDDPSAFWDFAQWSEVSYGYQVPYGKRGLPATTLDPGVVVVADKGPYGAAMEAGKANPGVPTAMAKSSPDDWRAWNSPNHDTDGQVVLYVDSHAEFVNKPTFGIKNDNIYTRWSSADGGFAGTDDTPRIAGTPPTSNETPWSDSDTLIYP